MKYLLTLPVLFLFIVASGQNRTKRTLFLGNSYTYVNDLPQMLHDVAASTNDTLIFDSNTIGGYTLQQHSTNTTSLSKIAAGNWDYVVLQEQSQLPSFPNNQVATDVFPYATMLDDSINKHNPCAETVFYMTWGRKNGDASNCANWPPVCTYEGMDSLLNLRYRIMAEDNAAILSPVGAVWHYIRHNFPQIELYQGDESHPVVAGTYAAACCFYAALFRKDPSLISFNPSLPADEALNIRNAAKLVVYDSLMNWHIGEYDPHAAFTYYASGNNTITFTNESSNATEYEWNFGDNSISADSNAIHTYPVSDSYTVMLIATDCGKSDTLYQTVYAGEVGIGQPQGNNQVLWNLRPNPTHEFITLSNTESGKLNYVIINPEGKEFIRGIMLEEERQVNISSLSEGVYFIQLFNNTRYFGLQKFIKSVH